MFDIYAKLTKLSKRVCIYAYGVRLMYFGQEYDSTAFHFVPVFTFLVWLRKFENHATVPASMHPW